jgi:hypothetical protein
LEKAPFEIEAVRSLFVKFMLLFDLSARENGSHSGLVRGREMSHAVEAADDRLDLFL